MQKLRLVVSAMVFVMAASASTLARGDDDLAAGFSNPPASAHPQTWWHWMNGNITKQGITADLEAMHRVGIVEANIITVANDIPPGPVPVMSPAFFDMVEFAAKEANRLGMTLCMDNCPGWSSSGGPWVTPDKSMMTVTSSQTDVKGGTEITVTLPQPPTKLNFYRDISVLAFPTPSGDADISLSSLAPTITSSAADFDAGVLLKGDKFVSLPVATPKQPQYIQLDLKNPVTIRTLTLIPGPKNAQCAAELEISDDGHTFQKIKSFGLPANKTTPIALGLGKSLNVSHLKIVFTGSAQKSTGVFIRSIAFSSLLQIDNLARKAVDDGGGPDPLQVIRDQQQEYQPAMAIAPGKMIDLTSSLQPDGKLKWSAPPGDWTILRIGYTTTGVTNHPAPPEATGLECDKFSPAGLDASWNGMMQPIIDRLGPLSGKVLVDCLIDSYEVGGQNWTPAMAAEFQKRNGYDAKKYLPVLFGFVVDSPAVSERFLWDWRRTISDLFAENYFGYFTTLCHKHGLKSMIEPYTGPFESIQCGSQNDIPMAEFWTGSQGHESVKMASSVGHIYGQPIIAAESFTGAPDHGSWKEDPYSLKQLGDLAFSEGINRFVFHRYAHQPWMNRFPGMTMGQWGINLERTNTWFEESKPWMDYISRSQFLLQRGMYVADVAYFCGESSPVVARFGNPELPPGYSDDAINTDVLLHKASVKDNRLVLDDGESYAALVLPTADPEITPDLLKKLHDFVNDGLTLVVGARPVHSPSLRDYPDCDQQVKQLVDELWGNCDGQQITQHPLGKGQVVWGNPLAEVLTSLAIKPDLEIGNNPLLFIHRRTPDADWYFVANHSSHALQAQLTFRIGSRQPELWHPDTGKMENAPVFSEADGRTTLPVSFDPAGSVFVVFRSPPAAEHIVAVEDAAAATPSGKLQIRKATWGAVDQAGSRDVTQLLSAKVVGDTLSLSASNKELGDDPSPLHVKQLVVDYTYDGKPAQITVAENSDFELPPGDDASGLPPYELKQGADGSSTLFLADHAGQFTLKTASGKDIHLTAADPKTIDLPGPWQVAFPPGWGAPATINMDKLVSWPDYPDKGVKYFSGTATYQKDIDIPADQLGATKSLILDLGEIKNLAHVKINDIDLGILWKPPFRVDLSTIAHAGTNHLEIAITNLWPNRIIGDLALPEDTQWSGNKPAAWPQWMLDGKPSPTGRFTFYTWRHWEPGAALLPSGLIGPVKLEAAEWLQLK